MIQTFCNVTVVNQIMYRILMAQLEQFSFHFKYYASYSSFARRSMSVAFHVTRSSQRLYSCITLFLVCMQSCHDWSKDKPQIMISVTYGHDRDDIKLKKNDFFVRTNQLIVNFKAPSRSARIKLFSSKCCFFYGSQSLASQGTGGVLQECQKKTTWSPLPGSFSTDSLSFKL